VGMASGKFARAKLKEMMGVRNCQMAFFIKKVRERNRIMEQRPSLRDDISLFKRN